MKFAKMNAPINEVVAWNSDEYDQIIDVRSPDEFRIDHIPTAINMPVLSNIERAEIGTIYVQKSRFLARKRGAIYVAKNIAHHLEAKLSEMGSDFRPLIYCWRGGQRSRAFAQICSEIGWHSHLLKGGYKSYRRGIVKTLEHIADKFKFIVIGGYTGSGKTDILVKLEEIGAQVVNLEGLAKHRGSLLGALPDQSQPSQKYFESQLVKKLSLFDKRHPIFIEAESSRIGKLLIPNNIWKHMSLAPLVMINVSRDARSEYLFSSYKNLISQTKYLACLIHGMKTRYGNERIVYWQNLLDDKNWLGLAKSLLKDHYDPAYQRSMKRHDRLILKEITQLNCSIESIANSVKQIKNLDIS
ncbi:MAG: tRNA 2-selenouridine(34) synthase MnmH [Rhodospirillaceae bacterium]|nr:tRNA 2-selenouridine(34) synthase MnmH [Rhodospirillaceae bacterium]OUT80442.1 MAG: tRNA 2-selenouridine(34) synthase MnmH [Rhodospirillaceae bacterium TMED23]|tara:strand:- start:1132 stop:2199 length:1068 start_codon:yes stop_codon:yes gene_type:complete